MVLLKIITQSIRAYFLSDVRKHQAFLEASRTLERLFWMVRFRSKF